jgi:hypothetical protein
MTWQQRAREWLEALVGDDEDDVCSAKSVRQTIRAAGAKLALLRAQGQHAAARALCAAVEAAACAGLARLQQERNAALRAGAAGAPLVAAAEAQIGQLETLFATHGFETHLLAPSFEPDELLVGDKDGEAASPQRGVSALRAGALALALLLALSVGLGHDHGVLFAPG